MPRTRCAIVLLTLLINVQALADETDPKRDAQSAPVWRQENRIIDLHTHIEALPKRFDRAIGVMNAAGVGVAIELGSGTVTPGKGGAPSDFEKKKAIADKHYPGRFLHYMLLDFAGFDDADWSKQAVAQAEKGHRLGAAGVKFFKSLGLVHRDAKGNLIPPDHPKLDPFWKRCGELGMPISIHTGDPKAFWEPLNETNERWAELKDHPNWWFGDPKKYPSRETLLGQFTSVIAKHPETTVLGVHFANNPEDIDWVDRQLDKYPNMMADVAARLPEIGRSDPEKLRRFFVKHQDRVLFGTDFQVWNRFVLGSAGDDERPTDHEALVFYQKCFRFFETDDRDWEHMTPIQGNWTISSINIPPAVQRKVYFDNARKMLARSYPAPTFKAKRVSADFKPDGKLDEPAWDQAPPARIEYGLADATARPGLSTCVRGLWSEKYLYLAFEAPYTSLTTKENPGSAERLGLWETDVVEIFLGTDPSNPKAYKEFEWAPNGEKLDVSIDLPKKDFPWSAGVESVAKIDRENKVWRVEARIPLDAISDAAPKAGTRWRANLFRNDKASGAFLAWRPTLTSTTHTPKRFGWLEFAE